jgi:hypothetical protein
VNTDYTHREHPATAGEKVFTIARLRRSRSAAIPVHDPCNRRSRSRGRRTSMKKIAHFAAPMISVT